MFHCRTSLPLLALFLTVGAIVLVNSLESTCRAQLIASSSHLQKNGTLKNIIVPMEFSDNLDVNTQTCRKDECFETLKRLLRDWNLDKPVSGTNKLKWRDHLCEMLGHEEFDGHVGIEMKYHCLDRSLEIFTTELRVFAPGRIGMEMYKIDLIC